MRTMFVLAVCLMPSLVFARDVSLEIGAGQPAKTQQLSHFYGWVDIGSSSRFALEIVNKNSKPMVFQKMAENLPGFDVDSDCPTSLAPSQACKIRLDFRPRVDMRHAENLIVGFADGEGIEVDLSGYGRRM